MKLHSAPPPGIRTCTVSWIALLVLSTLTFDLGAHAPSQLLMVIVLVLTLAKGQLVVNNFMGLRRVRPLWRIVMATYLAVVGLTIAVAYLIA